MTRRQCIPVRLDQYVNQDPRLIFKTQLVFKARLLFEEIRYGYFNGHAVRGQCAYRRVIAVKLPGDRSRSSKCRQSALPHACVSNGRFYDILPLHCMRLFVVYGQRQLPLNANNFTALAATNCTLDRRAINQSGMFNVWQ